MPQPTVHRFGTVFYAKSITLDVKTLKVISSEPRCEFRNSVNRESPAPEVKK